MKYLLHAGIACLIAAIFLGCKPADPMPGKWKAELPPTLKRLTKGSEVEADFSKDKTFVIRMELMRQNFDASGTYVIDGENIMLTSKDFGGTGTNQTQKGRLSADRKSFTMRSDKTGEDVIFHKVE